MFTGPQQIAIGPVESIKGIAEHGVASGPSTADPPSAEAIREELERLLDSVTFAAARAQKKFLWFTVAETLQGRGHLLKEFALGIEVFDRGESFDPRTHNTVRVEAGKLRAKLARYYDTEGRENPLRIEFPKGSYAPVFRRNPRLDSPEDVSRESREPQPANAAHAEPALLLRRVSYSWSVRGHLGSGAA